MTDKRSPADEAVRRYRRLLALFPSEYRAAVTEELCEVFRDEYLDVRQSGGAVGVAVLWVRVLLDVVVSLPGAWRSHLRARRDGRGKMGMGMGSWIGDLRIAARSLARRPGFALGVALTLGLGIGATTAVYSVVDEVILRPLPYNDPSTLVAVGALLPGTEWVDGDASLQNLAPISFPNYLDLRERARSFEDLTAIWLDEGLLAVGDADPEAVRWAAVSPGLFQMLDVSPALGRMLLPEDYVPNSEPVTVLTYGTWQRRYGGNPDVVGWSVDPGGDLTISTIVGVLSQDFSPPEAFFPSDEVPDMWMPMADQIGESRTIRQLYLLGRLARGTAVDQARAEAGRIAADLAVEYPADNVDRRSGVPLGIGVNGLYAQTVGTTGRALGLFLGAAGLLLLLAAMNAATLLLARSLDRTQEFGVRMALGARRGRIVRLLVSEAAILAVVGGALGVLLAYGGVGVFLRYAPSSISRLSTVAVDLRVLAVAALVSLGTGIAVGLLPALSLTRHGPWERLQRAGRSVAEPSRLRGFLVSGQMAVAVVLLCGAGLLFSSFVQWRAGAELGFEADGLVAFGVDRRDRYTHWLDWDGLLEELLAVPGVESVAAASSLPFQSPSWMPTLLLRGDTPETADRSVAGYAITPGYLDIMGTRLLRGRDFAGMDGPDAERVALVNESFVRTQLGGGDPIGTIVRYAEGTEWWVPAEGMPIRIVGVVEDVVQVRVGEGPKSAIYLPYTQSRPLHASAVIRSALPPEAIFSGLRTVAARYSEITFRELNRLRPPEGVTLGFRAMLTGAFALMATLLAAAGLYGSLAHSVGRRQREFGVRMALGADRAGVLMMVLSQGMRLAMAGLLVGMVATLLLTRVLTGFLYGVEPNDPATLLMVAAVMVVVSAAACLAPARRATAVDPVRVLKAE